MVNTIKFRRNLATADTADTAREPSDAIWARMRTNELQLDKKRGFFIHENFVDLAVLATPTITTEALYSKGWKAFGSSGGTILPAKLEGGGGIILTESDDNEGIGLAMIQTPFQIDRGKGMFGWEARLKVNSVADTRFGLLAGLGDQQTLTATVPITAAGALADENLVGWHRLEADGDQLDVVYKADGVTAVTVQADAIPTGLSLAADTFFKIGMLYEPFGMYGDYQASFWFNGVRTTTLKQIPTGDGTDFPNDVDLGLLFAMLCASGDDAITTIDWVQAAQHFIQ